MDTDKETEELMSFLRANYHLLTSEEIALLRMVGVVLFPKGERKVILSGQVGRD